MDTILGGAFPILYPRHVIYIHTSLSVLRQRHKLADDHLPFYFMDELFYTAFFSFFSALQRADPTRITVIDGSQARQETLRQIYEVLRHIS
jgi:thymidylate kinase